MRNFSLILLMIMAILSAESLKESVAIAISNNTSVKASEFKYQKSQELYKAVKRKQMAKLSLDSSYKYINETAEVDLPTGQTIELGQHDNYDSGLTLSWLAFNGHGKSASLKLAGYQQKAKELELSKTKKDIAYQTAQTYLNLQKIKLQKEIISTGRERMRLQQQKVKSWVDTGMALPLDLMTISLSLLNYDQQLITVEAAEQSTQDKLDNLTGQKIDVSIANKITLEKNYPKFNLEEKEKYEILQIQKQAILATQKLKSSANYPELFLNAGLRYGKPGVNPIDNEWMSYTTAGVGLNWLLWDWGGRSAELEAENIEAEIIKKQEQELEDQLKLNYDNALREYQTMFKQQEVLRKSVEVAKDRMKILEEQAKNGVVTATDFRDADADLTQYELKLNQQKLDIMIQQLKLDYLSGNELKKWRLE